jgi:hypothetical protein
MKPFCIALALLCAALNGMSQEEFVAPAAKLVTRFPFTQLSGGIIILHAKLDDYQDSLNFVLDTGSGGISLDSATVDLLKLKTVKTERIIRGIAGMRAVDFTMDHILKLPGLTTPNMDFHINDYDILTSVYGIKIDGIIGYSFLRRYVVRIDYDNQEIEVYTPGTFKYPRGGFLLKPNFSTLPLQTAVIDDGRETMHRFIFDTGAGLCLLLSRDYVNDSTIFKRNKKFYPTQAEGLGGKSMMSVAVAKELRVGPYKFKRVPVHIFEDEYNVTSYPMLGGLIGNDIFRRFNVILNYPEQSIHIKPNTHFNEHFDYSYTGLSMYLIDGEIRVIDVMPGSPGDKAGFLPGDVIFSVETNASKNIQTYKNLFQNSIGKIQVIIFRGNVPKALVVDVKDIRK